VVLFLLCISDNNRCFFVNEKEIGSNQRLNTEVKGHPKKSSPDLFGSLRNWKTDIQKLKDRLRKESEW